MRLGLKNLNTTRKTTLKTLLGVVAALAVGVAVPALAETGSPPAPDAQVGFQKKPQMSPQEQLSDAQNQLARMEAVSGTVRHMLAEARTARDVVKTLCLNDKLNQVDVAIRSAHERHDALRSAAGRNDAELSNHEYTMLAVLRQRAEQLGAEANQCIGEEAVLIGQSQTTMSVDPTLPPDTTDTQLPPTDPLVTTPPVCVSCSM